MTMKIDAKLGEELTCRFKIDMRNLTNFDPEHLKFASFKKLHYNGIFLTKVYNV